MQPLQRLILATLPTMVALLGFVWFRRKKKNLPSIKDKEEGSVASSPRANNNDVQAASNKSNAKKSVLPPNFSLEDNIISVSPIGTVYAAAPECSLQNELVSHSSKDTQPPVKDTTQAGVTNIEPNESECVSDAPLLVKKEVCSMSVAPKQSSSPPVDVKEKISTPVVEKLVSSQSANSEQVMCSAVFEAPVSSACVIKERPIKLNVASNTVEANGEDASNVSDTHSRDTSSSVNMVNGSAASHCAASNDLPSSLAADSHNRSDDLSNDVSKPEIIDQSSGHQVENSESLNHPDAACDVSGAISPDTEAQNSGSVASTVSKTSEEVQPVRDYTEHTQAGCQEQNHNSHCDSTDGNLPSSLCTGLKEEPDMIEKVSVERAVSVEHEPSENSREKMSNGTCTSVMEESITNGKWSEQIEAEDKLTSDPITNGDHIEPQNGIHSDSHSEVSSDSGKGNSVGETPQASSPTVDVPEYTMYEFDFPTGLCGRLIGRMGKNINSIKNKTGADIFLKRKPFIRDYQICCIQGTHSQVNAALAHIKKKFPPEYYEDVTYEQLNTTLENSVLPPEIMQMSLPEGVSVEVMVSSVVDVSHVFVQQPSHPTYSCLERLNFCMNACYGQDTIVPQLPRPIEVGVICAAPMYNGWYRAQVVDSHSDVDEYDIKFVDYGGYMRVQGCQLRQIRSDFTTLPFQAIECYMANILPPQDFEAFPPEASPLLENLVQGKVLQAQIVAHEEDGVPYVQLYDIQGEQAMFINRELVNQNMAQWIEYSS